MNPVRQEVNPLGTHDRISTLYALSLPLIYTLRYFMAARKLLFHSFARAQCLQANHRIWRINVHDADLASPSTD